MYVKWISQKWPRNETNKNKQMYWIGRLIETSERFGPHNFTFNQYGLIILMN